jgi:hypothetical protein
MSTSDTRPAKPRRYVRRVSPVERYWLVFNEIYHFHVDGIVEGAGQVDPAQLQAAVDRAAAANPAIRVRFRGFLGFARWVDSGIAPRVRLMPQADWDGSSERGAPFLLERLDALGGGPIADVLLVPCNDGKTRIVFRTLHAAIDGRGFMHWLAEVFRALRGEPLLGSSSNLIDLDVQEQYRGQVPERPKSAPVSAIPVLQPAEKRDGMHFIWRRAIIDNNVSQLLPKTAVFLADWARRQSQGEVVFTVPVDYRGLRTQEMGLGNLTGFLNLNIAEDATPRKVMQQLLQRIRAFGDVWQAPGIRLLYWIPIWFMARRLRPKVDAVLHNVSPALPSGGIVSMGNLTPEEHSFPGFRCHMSYGIPGAVGKLNVVFLNYPGFVVINFATPAAYNHRGQLDELVAAYQQHFSAAGSST